MQQLHDDGVNATFHTFSSVAVPATLTRTHQDSFGYGYHICGFKNEDTLGGLSYFNSKHFLGQRL